MTPAEARLLAASRRLEADKLEAAAAQAEAEGRDVSVADLDAMIESLDAAAAELRQSLGLPPLG